MKIFLPICLLFLIAIGCKKEVNTDLQKEEKNSIILDSLSKEAIKIDLQKLSPESQKDIADFDDFTYLQNIIKTMHSANPYYISKYADSVNTITKIFKRNLTKEFKVNTISSRMVVLSTESNLLLELSKKNPPAEKLITANTNLIKAYNSLIIQLNELSLAIPENIEKELLRDNNIIKDSISEAEKQNLPIEE